MKNGARKVMKKPMTKHEQIAWVLRHMERQGLVSSNLGRDGKVYWRLTEKGKRVEPVWSENSEELLN